MKEIHELMFIYLQNTSKAEANNNQYKIQIRCCSRKAVTRGS